jgi:hypothetical protein
VLPISLHGVVLRQRDYLIFTETPDPQRKILNVLLQISENTDWRHYSDLWTLQFLSVCMWKIRELVIKCDRVVHRLRAFWTSLRGLQRCVYYQGSKSKAWEIKFMLVILICYNCAKTQKLRWAKLECDSLNYSVIWQRFHFLNGTGLCMARFELAVDWLALLSFRKVPGLNLGPRAHYPEGFRIFLSGN